MKIGVIVAEYNPFHLGHAAQIDAVRESGVTHLAVVMSGQFVQRGDVAICSKWIRAQAAILCGADLVVELPTLFALQAARTFAAAGVFLASQFPAATLFFGAETPDLSRLQAVSEHVESAEQHPLFATYLKSGVSHPKAREQTVSCLFSPEDASLLTQPNNLLALEYLQAIKKSGRKLIPHPMPRQGAAHHATTPVGDIASASCLRELWLGQSLSECLPYLPPAAAALYQQAVEAGVAPMRLDRLERAILAHLRQSHPEVLRELDGGCEGLEHRILRLAGQVSSLSELFSAVTTKRYPTARIRRIVLQSFLTPPHPHTPSSSGSPAEPPANISTKSVFPSSTSPMPAYLRVLGMNERGAALLRAVKRESNLPMTASFSRIATHPHAVFESNATDLAALMTPHPLPVGTEFTTPLYRAKFCS